MCVTMYVTVGYHFFFFCASFCRHAGALFEMAALEQNTGNYHHAMALLKQAIDGKETVNENVREEYLGAPTLSDATSALATV